jgi:oligopeptide transport system permease protein
VSAGAARLDRGARLKQLGLFSLQRLLMLVTVLWLVATAVFLMLRFVPGGPFAQQSERDIPERVLQQLEAKMGLDQPLWKQYVYYIGNLARLDLGVSMTIEGQSVNELIAVKFPRSARLGFLSVIFAIAIGLPAGLIAAHYRNRWPDKVSLGIAIFGVSVPNFVLAAILLLVFVLHLRQFPAFGISQTGRVLDELRYLLLPAVALTGFSLAYITRLLRSSMLDVLSQDYIVTARAKGLSAPVVLFKHGLRNAVLPVLTYLGPLVAATFTGSFVIETIFSFPGLGEYFVTSITNRDYTVVLGVTVFYSTFLISMNMLVDIVYGIVDPRIEVG